MDIIDFLKEMLHHEYIELKSYTTHLQSTGFAALKNMSHNYFWQFFEDMEPKYKISSFILLGVM